jgi:hypothetical protein
MSIFLNKDDLVAVSTPDDPTNVVWVRRKMNLGTRNRVQDALMSVEEVDGQLGHRSMNINLGKQNTILLQFNIVKWEGPKFRDETNQPVPCTPQMIEMLDPDDPLVDAVLERINALNAKQVVVEDGKPVDPLSSTPASSKPGKGGLTLLEEPTKQAAKAHG